MKTRISLRMRITLLTGIVIAVVAVLLTSTSMLNAHRGLYNLSDTARKIIKEDALSAGDTGDGAESGASSLYTPEIVPDTAERLKPPPDGDSSIIQAESEVRKKFNLLSIVSLFGAITIGMAAAYLLAGRALSPVYQLSQAAGKISAENMHFRLEPSGMPDDIGVLVNTFNSMLDRLENSFENQKRFSSNVAHELKTPLTTMKMSLQVAQLENKDPENVTFFTTTERSVDRLSGVVASLLSLTDESPIELCDEINLSESLLNAVDGLQTLYADKNLHVESIFESGEARVMGNLRLVQQLINNLVENAMKYTPPGGTIHLSTDRSAETLRITVSDNGPGIPIDKLNHIFEPFYCVDSSRSRKLGGAGLGLSIARMVSRRHGWTLEAENASMGGAVFTIKIPAQQIL